MPRYTVQCAYPEYYTHLITVEADTLEEALELAIDKADDDPSWKNSDYCGQTFIDGVAAGDDKDPWGPNALPVPPSSPNEPATSTKPPRPRARHIPPAVLPIFPRATTASATP